MLRLLFILIILSFFAACSSDEVRKGDIIEDDAFFEILKDFHKAEGIITIAKLNDKKNKNDTISPYNYILKKHNISRIDFDKTVKYYANHTEEYIPFYDSINNYFLKQKKELQDQFEENLKKISPEEQFASKNLWTKKQEWLFTSSKKTDKIKLDFKVNTNYRGKYNLTLDVLTKPDVKTIEERVSLFANYKDGTKDKAKIIKKTISKKNKNFKHLEISIKTNKNKKLKSISGNVINFSKKENIHFHIKNIEIKYVYKKKKKENKKIFIK